jgi:hypothetical protein
MKIRSIILSLALAISGIVFIPSATASENPKVESFTFSPQEIDLTAADTKVTFELTVSHPSGIENSVTLLTLTNGLGITMSEPLTRTDIPVNAKLAKVVFKGSITIPRNTTPGVYTFSANEVKNNSSAGYQYGTGKIVGGVVRNLVGAESGLLIRTAGNLKYDYQTFYGPSYDNSLNFTYTNKVKYNAINQPIWKVGETVKISDYYELQVPELALKLSSTTPSVCAATGIELKLLSEGNCTFLVSTAATKDYLEVKDSQSSTITAARQKPKLEVVKVETKDIKLFPASFEVQNVYSISGGYIFPLSISPTVCYTSGFFVKLIAAGTCSLTYQTAVSATYLASDLYTQSFQVLDNGVAAPVVAPTPVATPTATPTAKPVVKRTISCVKGTKTVKKTAVSPKCPKGYKLKK